MVPPKLSVIPDKDYSELNIACNTAFRVCLEHTNNKANECTLLCFDTSSPFAGRRKCFSFHVAICLSI